MPPEKPRPNRTPTPPPQPAENAGETDYAFGKNSVSQLLATAPDRVFKILFAEELIKDRRLAAVLNEAKTCGVAFQVVPRARLDRISDGDIGHQGVIAMVSPKPLLDVYDLTKKVKAMIEAGQAPTVLMLDDVTDPRNFGAIVRVAAAAGVTAIVIPKTKSAGFSPAVRKTSAGTLEIMDICVVPNLVDAMERLKPLGLWWVGAALGEKVTNYSRYDFTGPTGIVMGSEDTGIRRLVREHCDTLVQIPMAPGVESLNVSVATGVLLFESLRQRNQKASASERSAK